MRPEQHFYIPPDVTLNADGSIPNSQNEKVYRFNTLDRHLLSFTGLGMPAIYYITQRGPRQNGETILGYRLQERYVQYVVRNNALCSRDNYWDERSALINYLRPNRQPVTGQFSSGRLRVVRPDGVTRDISATIQDGPRFVARTINRWDEWSFTEILRFKCEDPTFFNPDLEEVEWTVDVFDGLIFYAVGGYEDYLTFPDNAVFGSEVISGAASIAYTGTWLAYPIIYITGPVDNPAITNATLNQKISLSYNVSAGEIVTIDTSYGVKTVTNNTGTNLIGTLTNDSDLGLHIGCDPEAPNGVNNFEYFGGGGIPGTSSIRLTYYTRYIGI